MVACTLDYDWPTYVVASLISLFGGLLVLLLVRYVLRCSPITSDRLRRCQKHLLNVQEAADTILSGDSLVSKIFVSFAFITDRFFSSPGIRAILSVRCVCVFANNKLNDL